MLTQARYRGLSQADSAAPPRAVPGKHCAPAGTLCLANSSDQMPKFTGYGTKEGSGSPTGLQLCPARHCWLWLLLTGAGPTPTTGDTVLPAASSHGQEQGAGHQRQDPHQRLQGLSQAPWVGNVFRARAHYLPRLGLHPGGGTLWPLSRWSHSHFSEKQHNPLRSLLPRLPEQHKELRAARMPGASAEGTQTCTLWTPDNSATFAVLAGR